MQGMSVAEITYQQMGSAQVLSPAQFSPHLLAQILTREEGKTISESRGEKPANSDEVIVTVKQASREEAKRAVESAAGPASGWQVAINVPAFNVSFMSKVIRVSNEDDYRRVAVEAFIDPSVSALLNLTNEPLDGDTENLAITHVNLGVDVTEHRPRAVFIAGSLYSMLGLAGPVNVSIPAAQLNLELYFPIELSEISGLLQGRQTSFGLMVIEKATGLEIEIPEHETEDDRNAICFAYRAITERAFVWPTYEVTMPMLATDQSLAWIDSPQSTKPSGSTYTIALGPSPKALTIFGQTVSLGDQTAFIENGIIDDLEKVRSELAERDGHLVRVRIRPSSRKVRYVFDNPPQLPNDPWDEKIEQFIKLEEMLNKRLAARYHALAASTVADLTPKEIEAVIARPELGEDAYLIRD
jgi:hypothetical protein